jgi:hypothetical protein
MALISHLSFTKYKPMAYFCCSFQQQTPILHDQAILFVMTVKNDFIKEVYVFLALGER